MEDVEKGAFNSAALYCIELTMIRRRLHEARITHNFDMFYDLLVSYYLALSARLQDTNKKGVKLKEPLQEKHDKAYAQVTKYYNEYQSLKRKGHKTVPSRIWQAFVLWERELRKEENKLGLLMKDTSDPAFAVGAGQF